MLFQSVVGMWKNIESNHVNQAFCLLLRLDLQHLHMTHAVTLNNTYNHRKALTPQSLHHVVLFFVHFADVIDAVGNKTSEQ